MKKARIIFNGKEKLIDITEEFHTEFRVLNELAGMGLEECKFLHPPKEYRHLPYLQMPKEVLEDILRNTPLDEDVEKFQHKYDVSLANLIEEHFNVKVNRDAFSGESFYTSKEDIKNGIVMHEVYDDFPYKPKNKSKNKSKKRPKKKSKK